MHSTLLFTSTHTVPNLSRFYQILVAAPRFTIYFAVVLFWKKKNGRFIKIIIFDVLFFFNNLNT